MGNFPVFPKIRPKVNPLDMETGRAVIGPFLSVARSGIEVVERVLVEKNPVRRIGDHVGGIPVGDADADFRARRANAMQFLHGFHGLRKVFQHMEHAYFPERVGGERPGR